MLSETVSKALQLTGRTDVQETVKFVEMFDKFADCLNVNNYNTGRLKRKVFKQPYRSATDFRLKVQCALLHTFVGINMHLPGLSISLWNVMGDLILGVIL